MNTETGKVQPISLRRSLERRADGKPRFIPVAKLPSPSCPRCKGTGSRWRGTKARGLFVPCRCVL